MLLKKAKRCCNQKQCYRNCPRKERTAYLPASIFLLSFSSTRNHTKSFVGTCQHEIRANRPTSQFSSFLHHHAPVWLQLTHLRHSACPISFTFPPLLKQRCGTVSQETRDRCWTFVTSSRWAPPTVPGTMPKLDAWIASSSINLEGHLYCSHPAKLWIGLPRASCDGWRRIQASSTLAGSTYFSCVGRYTSPAPHQTGMANLAAFPFGVFGLSPYSQGHRPAQTMHFRLNRSPSHPTSFPVRGSCQLQSTDELIGTFSPFALPFCSVIDLSSRAGLCGENSFAGSRA